MSWKLSYMVMRRGKGGDYFKVLPIPILVRQNCSLKIEQYGVQCNKCKLIHYSNFIVNI